MLNYQRVWTVTIRKSTQMEMMPRLCPFSTKPWLPRIHPEEWDDLRWLDVKKLDGKYDLSSLSHQMLPPHGSILRWRTVGEHWTNCTTAISMFPLAPKVQKSSWKSKFLSTSSPQITRSEAQYLLQISLSNFPNISQKIGNIYIYLFSHCLTSQKHSEPI